MFRCPCATVYAATVQSMTTRPFLRVLSALLVAGLFAGAVPASPAEASRAACRTSKIAKIPVRFDSDPWLRGKGCVRDGVLALELKQYYFRHLGDTILREDILGFGAEIVLYVNVHSTKSKGRYLDQVVFTDELWLGNPRDVFRDADGEVLPHKRLPDMKLPDLAAGTYQVSFELVLKASGDFDKDKLPSGTASTGPTYIKVKVS